MKYLFILTIVTVLCSCNQDSPYYDYQYDRTAIFPIPWYRNSLVYKANTRLDISQGVRCKPNGNNCHDGFGAYYIPKDVEQFYTFFKTTNYRSLANPGSTGTNTFTLNRNDISVQGALFSYYYKYDSPKLYFKNENWTILFPHVANDVTLKNRILSDQYDVAIAPADGSVIFVKSYAGGYGVSNVLYVYKNNEDKNPVISNTN
jgi:hypothetical protein